MAYEPPLFGSCSISFESDPPYWSLRDALMNTFTISQYAICVLKGYMIAIIKTSFQHHDVFYIFDSHSRDSLGWPTGNEGTAALMTFANLSFLANHICTLSQRLNVGQFEMLAVRFSSTGQVKAKAVFSELGNPELSQEEVSYHQNRHDIGLCLDNQSVPPSWKSKKGGPKNRDLNGLVLGLSRFTITN